MANICSNYCEISGPGEQMEALHKRLLDQDPVLLEAVPNFTICDTSDYCIYDSENISFNGNMLSIEFNSKNVCPLDDLATLSEEYPGLEFQLNFNEPDCEYYGSSSISNGSYSENMMEEKEYLESYNNTYIMELADLNNCSYDEFLEKYTHGNFFYEHPVAYIDRDVLDRIKDKDLAKFINRQWMDNKAEAEFKRRLSGGSK